MASTVAAYRGYVQRVPTVVTEDGVEIAWYDFGGDGPDLLLAHATGFHAHVWLPIVEQLRTRFRCVAFDERGHGDSAAPADGDFGWHGFARDALAVVRAAGLERPFGVGHSCGGASLLLAEEAAPGTFRALYCYEPVVYPGDDPVLPSGPTPLAETARRRREVFESREAVWERYASRPPTAAFAPDALRAYVDFGFDDLPDGTVRLKCRRENEARTYDQGFAHDAYRHLARITCPVTFSYGGLPTFGREVMEAMAARLVECRVECEATLTHFGPLEDPEAVAAAVVRAFAPTE